MPESKITAEEREDLTRLIMQVRAEGDQKWRDRAKMGLDALRNLMPDLDNETLAVFALVLAHTSGKFATVPVKDLFFCIDITYTSYSLVAAHLLGMYDTEAAEPPGVSRPYNLAGPYL